MAVIYVVKFKEEDVVIVVFFTLTDRASTMLSNIRGCQSGTWSQEVPRSTGHIMVTARNSDQQGSKSRQNAMRLYKRWHRPITTVHQTSFTPYREQPRSTRIVVAYPRPAFSATNRTNTFQPVLINMSKFFKATHRTKIRKIEIPRSMVVEALSWRSRRASQHPAVQSPVHP